VKLLICCPIPDPSAWLISANQPDGYMVLRSLTIAPPDTRVPGGTVPKLVHARAAKTPGSALVAAKDIDAPADHLQRLVAAWARCGDEGRAEVLKIAEVLAGATA
jgi:hypothetical protein